MVSACCWGWPDMWLDYLLGALVAAAVLLALAKLVRDRRKGRGCACGCASCPGCDRRRS